MTPKATKGTQPSNDFMVLEFMHMPGVARVIFAELPDRITQRGNRCEPFFLKYEDRIFYLKWPEEDSKIKSLFRHSTLSSCLPGGG